MVHCKDRSSKHKLDERRWTNNFPLFDLPFVKKMELYLIFYLHSLDHNFVESLNEIIGEYKMIITLMRLANKSEH